MLLETQLMTDADLKSLNFFKKTDELNCPCCVEAKTSI